MHVCVSVCVWEREARTKRSGCQETEMRVLSFFTLTCKVLSCYSSDIQNQWKVITFSPRGRGNDMIGAGAFVSPFSARMADLRWKEQWSYRWNLTEPTLIKGTHRRSVAGHGSSPHSTPISAARGRKNRGCAERHEIWKHTHQFVKDEVKHRNFTSCILFF